MVSYQHVHTTLVWGVLSPRYFHQPLKQLARLNRLADVLVGDDAPLERTPFSSIGRVGSRVINASHTAVLEEACAADATDGSGGGGGDSVGGSGGGGGGGGKMSRRLTQRTLAALSLDGLPRWKIFSAAPFPPLVLEELFLWYEAESVVTHAWDAPGAYPRSRPLSLAELKAPFVLHEHQVASSAQGEADGKACAQQGAAAVLHPSALEMATSAMEVMAVAARNAALLVASRSGGACK